MNVNIAKYNVPLLIKLFVINKINILIKLEKPACLRLNFSLAKYT